MMSMAPRVSLLVGFGMKYFDAELSKVHGDAKVHSVGVSRQFLFFDAPQVLGIVGALVGVVNTTTNGSANAGLSFAAVFKPAREME